MPSRFGRDRVSTRGDGALVLISPYPKRWRSRIERTLTSAEFPGTAVSWNDQVYEVIEADELSSGRSTYVLKPWSEQHQIRTHEVYDSASEERRSRNYTRDQERLKKGSRLAWLGVVFGHLPGWVQRELELEYGVMPTRQTMISTVPFFFPGVVAAANLPMQGSPSALDLPAWFFPIAGLLFLESLFRFRAALAGRPMGSMLGVAIFNLFLRGRFRRSVETSDLEHAARFPRRQGATAFFDPGSIRVRDWKLKSRVNLDTPAEVALRDAYSVREPFAAFLRAEDQLRIAERFDFDYVRWGTVTAAVVLAFAALGVLNAFVGSFSATKLLSLCLALVLSAEQIMRLKMARDGRPAPSILGRLLRPWMRPLLEEEGVLTPPPSELRSELPDVWDGDERPSPER